MATTPFLPLPYRENFLQQKPHLPAPPRVVSKRTRFGNSRTMGGLRETSEPPIFIPAKAAGNTALDHCEHRSARLPRTSRSL